MVVRDQQVADRLFGALKVAAIGGEGIRRRSPLGSEQGEEGVDFAGNGQPRATASAAIIRASASSPTRWSAETMRYR